MTDDIKPDSDLAPDAGSEDEENAPTVDDANPGDEPDAAVPSQTRGEPPADGETTAPAAKSGAMIAIGGPSEEDGG